MNIASRPLIFFAAAAAACALQAAETHADLVVSRILDNVARLKAADPEAVPMAFWDFDGTIIKGDVAVGLDEDGQHRFKGLMERTIESGLSPVYSAADGWREFWESDYPRLKRLGLWLAWPFNAQIFEGVESARLDAFCRAEFEKTYRKWYFASSMKIFRALKAAGVENYVISGSPEVFVRNAAETLGVPRERLRGIRVDEIGGRMTTKLVYPLPFADDKIDNLREFVKARPHGVALAAFGNSYYNDAPFMRYVVSQTNLPGGAKGTALMINGMKKRPGYEGLFLTADQDEVVGEQSGEPVREKH